MQMTYERFRFQVLRSVLLQVFSREETLPIFLSNGKSSVLTYYVFREKRSFFKYLTSLCFLLGDSRM